MEKQRNNQLYKRQQQTTPSMAVSPVTPKVGPVPLMSFKAEIPPCFRQPRSQGARVHPTISPPQSAQTSNFSQNSMMQPQQYPYSFPFLEQFMHTMANVGAQLNSLLNHNLFHANVKRGEVGKQ
jgi:hypothetical protein